MAAVVHACSKKCGKAALALIIFVFLTFKSAAQIGTPPIIVVQPVGVSVQNGGTLVLTSTVISVSSMKFTWLRNGQNIPNGRSSVANIVVPLVGTVSTLTVNNINSSDAATYTLTVQNGVGSATSSNAVVLINVAVPPVTLPALLPATSKMLTDGFHLQLSAPAGTNYIVQASTDLVNWTPVYTNVGTGAAVSWTDAAAMHIPGRYYRIQY